MQTLVRTRTDGRSLVTPCRTRGSTGTAGKENGLDGKKLAYSVEEACQALGIGRALTYELIMSGRLHSIKVGARRLIPASALQEFLAGTA
jgi:excisionase family DNA binding protein